MVEKHCTAPKSFQSVETGKWYLIVQEDEEQGSTATILVENRGFSPKTGSAAQPQAWLHDDERK